MLQMKSKNEKCISLLWSDPKGYISLQSVLLIKMGSVLSSLSFLFLFLPNPGCMGPISLSQDPTLVPCVAADHKHMVKFLQTVSRHNSQPHLKNLNF